MLQPAETYQSEKNGQGKEGGERDDTAPCEQDDALQQQAVQQAAHNCRQRMRGKVAEENAAPRQAVLAEMPEIFPDADDAQHEKHDDDRKFRSAADLGLVMVENAVEHPGHGRVEQEHDAEINGQGVGAVLAAEADGGQKAGIIHFSHLLPSI